MSDSTSCFYFILEEDFLIAAISTVRDSRGLHPCRH